MRIIVNDIPSEGLELREEEKPDFFGFEDDKFVSYISPVSVSIMAEKTGGSVKVKGEAGFEAEFICVRCLEPFLKKIKSPLDIVYQPEPIKITIQKEEFLEEKDEDAYYYGKNGIIELKDVIRENIILSMPIKPVCASNCAGLCPSCGKNLNKGEKHGCSKKKTI